ncbi:MAG: hypothetical protein WBD20_10535 [Pirellulaceae bacterium]
MHIRFLVACCLLTPVVAVSAQSNPAGASDGNCRHAHPLIGRAYGATMSDQLSARVYADECGSGSASSYDLPQRSRMTSDPLDNQYRSYGNADEVAPVFGDQPYTADPNQV